MPIAAWATLGACCGIALTWASAWLLSAVTQVSEKTPHGPAKWWYASAAVLGSATSLIGSRAESLRDAVLLWLVMALFLVQSPLDVTLRRLSRPVTLSSLVIVASILIVDSLAGDSRDAEWSAVLITLLMGSGYALMYILSPRSIGLGDVLLVLPLALTIASVNPSAVVTWQLLASSGAAVQGVVARLAVGLSMVPFGPYLLGAAWLVLAFSV